ncbi:MAG: hypothetical protein JOY62_03240 [Acidobacteriaceae bacterium]|nr:hypothetical protein [Acidobacteriaceae bacterium]MBV9778965.1 hypothetical protein [Acidobacteriaceae bacterium]
MRSILRAASIVSIAAGFLLADVTYDETMRFKGGTLLDIGKILASEGGKSAAIPEQKFTVYVKEGRMARVGDLFSVIYDSDAHTVTLVNSTTHTYSVTTFDAIREQIQQQGMSTSEDPNKGLNVTVDKPGQTRTIDGQTATEVITTMKASVGNANRDVVSKLTAWIVPLTPATRELSDLLKRLSAKFADAFTAAPVFGNSWMSVDMWASKQIMNLDGYPALIEMEVSGIRLPATAGAEWTNVALTLEAEIESSNFVSGPVDDSKFAIPAGYTKKSPGPERLDNNKSPRDRN